MQLSLSSDQTMADREFPFTASDFRLIAEIAHREAGITLPDVKEPLVYSRLIKRLRKLGLRGFTDYCTLIASAEGAEERVQMISALTTNVTHFFREGHHFRHLEETVLPPLIERAKRGGRVRLWSAGCATGEEAYSIAFSLLRLCPEAARYDIRILATDIDPQVLESAEIGLYREKSIAALPDWARETQFESVGPEDEMLRVGPAAREVIRFRRLNLIRPWPFRGPFDVIFCRNVTIYFDAATQAALWDGFAQWLQPGGFLYIGHSERLSEEIRPRFDLAGMTVFRLKAADGAVRQTGAEGENRWR